MQLTHFISFINQGCRVLQLLIALLSLCSLILYGVVSNMQDRPEMAETFFEAATSFEPKSVLAWTMLGTV